jgi:hypothetical protein
MATQSNQVPKQPIGPGQGAQIKIADNLPGAEYANAMQVRHNQDEFQLMFISIMGGSGKVTGKIVTPPGHMKRMISAMQEAIKKYEAKHGEIKVSSSPIEKEIGFKG